MYIGKPNNPPSDPVLRGRYLENRVCYWQMVKTGSFVFIPVTLMSIPPDLKEKKVRTSYSPHETLGKRNWVKFSVKAGITNICNITYMQNNSTKSSLTVFDTFAILHISGVLKGPYIPLHLYITAIYQNISLYITYSCNISCILHYRYY